MPFKAPVPWERYALISTLAESFRDRGRVLGKTALQKLVYFLQEGKDVPIGYDFVLYNYGPFCVELANDLDFTETLGGVTVHTNVSFPGGYCIYPGPRSEEIKSRGRRFWLPYEHLLFQVLEDFGALSAKDLELRATILYARRFTEGHGQPFDDESILEHVVRVKPQFAVGEIAAAIEEMREKGYLDR